jgi:hypothetical protein
MSGRNMLHGIRRLVLLGKFTFFFFFVYLPELLQLDTIFCVFDSVMFKACKPCIVVCKLMKG